MVFSALDIHAISMTILLHLFGLYIHMCIYIYIYIYIYVNYMYIYISVKHRVTAVAQSLDINQIDY